MPNSMSLKTVAVVVMLSAISLAASANPDPNSQPAVQHLSLQSSDVNGTSDPQAVAIFEKVVARYKAMKTYSEQIDGVMEYIKTDANGVQTTREKLINTTLKLARPELYRINWSVYGVNYPQDPGSAWGNSAGNWMIWRGDRKTFDNLRKTMVAANAYAVGCLETVTGMFFSDMPNMFELPQRLQLLKDERVAGDWCYVMSGRQGNRDTTYWISKLDLVLRKRVAVLDGNTPFKVVNPEQPDSTEVFGMMKNFKFIYTEIHRDIVIDAEMPVDAFDGEKPLPGSAVLHHQEPNKPDPNSLPAGQNGKKADNEFIWGQVAGGLRAAVELVPEKEYYSLDEAIGIQFRIQNVSNKSIELPTTKWRFGNESMCVIQDSNGKKIPITHVWFSGWSEIERYELLSGEILTLKAASLGLAKTTEDAKAFNHPVGYIAALKNEKYSLHFELLFPDIMRKDAKGNAIVLLHGDWQGTLITGTRSLCVEPKANSTNSAPAPNSIPAGQRKNSP